MGKRKADNAVFEEFYVNLRMLDRLNYIKRVIGSCKNEREARTAFNWGKKVLWEKCKAAKFDNLDTPDEFRARLKMINYTSALERDLVKCYESVSGELW